MKLNSEQLQAQLSRGLAPVYLVSGDEVLLVQEVLEALRQAAAQAGYSERTVLAYETGFDWDSLKFETDSLSLFGDRRLIELRLASTKIGDRGSKAIQQYTACLADDRILVIACAKLDQAQLRTKWVKAVDSAGIIVQVWPVDSTRLPQWIRQRAQRLGLELSREAVMLLADRVEGNLLAAAQELEKLRLLQGEGGIDEHHVRELVSDSARFTVYALVDYCLSGRTSKAVHALDELRAEGVEAVLVLWALTRELRTLSSIAQRLSQAEHFEKICSSLRIWERRKPLVRAALDRHPPAFWPQALYQCAQIDLAIKGLAGTHKPWDSLLRLCVALCGKKLFSVATP